MSASLLRLLLITCACTREEPLYLSVCVKGTDCLLCCTGHGLFVHLGEAASLSPPQVPLYGGLAVRAGPHNSAVALRLVEEEARVAFRRDAASASAAAAKPRVHPRGSPLELPEATAVGPGTGVDGGVQAWATPPLLPPPELGPGGARPASRDVRASGGGVREVRKRYGGFMRRVGRPKGRWPKRAKKKRYGGFIHRFFGLAIRSPRLE